MSNTLKTVTKKLVINGISVNMEIPATELSEEELAAIQAAVAAKTVIVSATIHSHLNTSQQWWPQLMTTKCLWMKIDGIEREAILYNELYPGGNCNGDKSANRTNTFIIQPNRAATVEVMVDTINMNNAWLHDHRWGTVTITEDGVITTHDMPIEGPLNGYGNVTWSVPINNY